jgi:hypothetical protein
MFDTLPDDVKRLIFAHRAAMTIQTTVRKHISASMRFSHSLHPQWHVLKQRLMRTRYLMDVCRFPAVRKEWRQEMESWLCLTDAELNAVCEEVLSHPHRLWGTPDVVS